MKQICLLILVLLGSMSMGFSQIRGSNTKFDADANPYEKLLKDTSTGKRTAKFLMNFNQPVVIRDYFNSSPCNEYATLSNARISQFNAFVEEFVKGSMDAKQMTKAMNDFKKRGLAGQLADIDYHIGNIEKQGTFTGDTNTPLENLLCRAKGSVQAIKSIVAYLEAVKKLFPSLEGIDDAIRKGKEALLAYPDNKSLLDIIQKNLKK